MINRRQFSTAVAGACLAPPLLKAAMLPAPSKKKIAFIGTDVFEHSHAQHFLDRFHTR